MIIKIYTAIKIRIPDLGLTTLKKERVAKISSEEITKCLKGVGELFFCHTEVSDDKDDSDYSYFVKMITTAYEGGVGHGMAKDSVRNPYIVNSVEYIAWKFGYELGKERSV